MDNFSTGNGAVRFLLYVGVGVSAVGIAYLIFRLCGGVLLPFLLAWGLSYLLQPAVRFCSAHTRLSCRAVRLFFLASILIFLGAFLVSMTDRVLDEAGNLIRLFSEDISDLPQTLFSAVDSLAQRFPNVPFLRDGDRLRQLITDTAADSLNRFSAKLPSYLASVAAALPDFLLLLSVTVIAAFLIGKDYEKINGFLLGACSDRIRSFACRFSEAFRFSVRSYCRAYFVMMLVTLAELWCGFAILKINYAFTIALLTSLVDLLPVFGVGTVLLPWSAVLLFSGSYYLGFGLLILFAVTWLVRRVLEPKLIGTPAGFNAAAMLIILYVGYRLGGLLGMLLFPLLALTLKILYRPSLTDT